MFYLSVYHSLARSNPASAAGRRAAGLHPAVNAPPANLGKVDEFLRELSVEGNLSDAERARLVEIADRCPVHRTLHSEVKVRTRLAD